MFLLLLLIRFFNRCPLVVFTPRLDTLPLGCITLHRFLFVLCFLHRLSGLVSFGRATLCSLWLQDWKLHSQAQYDVQQYGEKCRAQRALGYCLASTASSTLPDDLEDVFTFEVLISFSMAVFGELVMAAVEDGAEIHIIFQVLVPTVLGHLHNTSSFLCCCEFFDAIEAFLVKHMINRLFLIGTTLAKIYKLPMAKIYNIWVNIRQNIKHISKYTYVCELFATDA